MSTFTEAAQPVTPDAILQLGFAWWGSKTLLSAVELGLFSELAASGSLDADELRALLGLHPRGARDFLDALVALNLLERDNGCYRNAPATDVFLDAAKPSYLGDFLLMAGDRPTWDGLTEALRSGRPQHEGDAEDDFFDAVYPDPDKLAEFLCAMTANSAGSARAGRRGCLGALRQRHRRRVRRGRRSRRARARARAPALRRVRPAARAPVLRAVRVARRRRRAGALPRR